MEETTQDKPSLTLPFENLYLVSGLVHGANRGWMYLFTFLLLLMGYSGFQLVIFYPLENLLIKNGYTEQQVFQNIGLIFDSKALGLDRNVIFLLELMMFVFAFIGFYIGLRFIHRKSLTSVLTGYQRFRYRRFFFAFMIWGALVLIISIVDYLVNPVDYTVNFNPGGFLFSVFIMGLLMPVQTGLEEVFFRGYLVQGLALVFKNGIAPLVLTSALFALAHMTNPEVKEYGWAIMFVYYGCFALFMGGVTLLDEGLELAFGIHLANNMISSMIVSSPHSVIKTHAILESAKEDPYTEIVVWLVMALITFIIFKRKYRWTNFQLLIK